MIKCRNSEARVRKKEIIVQEKARKQKLLLMAYYMFRVQHKSNTTHGYRLILFQNVPDLDMKRVMQ